jgi:hypothetical protein
MDLGLINFIMNKDSPQNKPKLGLARLLLNSSIMAALFFNPELM